MPKWMTDLDLRLGKYGEFYRKLEKLRQYK